MTIIADTATIDAATMTTAPAKTSKPSMMVACLQENVKQALAVVSHAVPGGKALLPVLNNILLKAEGKRLMVQATDLETAITVWVATTSLVAGSTTLPAKFLSDFVNTLSNTALIMKLDGKTETVNITCDRSEANIKGIGAEEWSSIPNIKLDSVISAIPAGQLRTAIRQVVFAAGDETSKKPVFKGVLVRVENKEITFFATDGFRFAVKTVELEAEGNKKQELIIPAKSLVALDRALSVVDETTPIRASITANRGHVLFAAENLEVMCRLMEGPHVPFEKVFAVLANVTTSAVMDAEQFVRLTKQAQVFSAQSAYITKFAFQPITDGAGSVTLTANAAEAGDNKAVIDAQITGTAGEFAASSRYVLDALGVLPTKDAKVAFDVVSPQAPALIRLVGDDSLKLIVMPMQIQG